MAWLGTESAVDALADYIEANVAAKVTALNAEYADSSTVTLAAPVATLYTRKQALSVQNYPVLFVLPVSGESVPSSISGGLGQMDQRPVVLVGILDKANGEGDWETCQRRLYRWSRALKELIETAIPGSLSDWAMTDSGYVDAHGSLADFSDAMADDVAVQITLSKREARTT